MARPASEDSEQPAAANGGLLARVTTPLGDVPGDSPTRPRNNNGSCARCHTEFSLFHRQHSCRTCRAVVCSRCSSGWGSSRKCFFCLADGSADSSSDRPSPEPPRRKTTRPDITIDEPIRIKDSTPLKDKWKSSIPGWVKTHMPRSCLEAWKEGFGMLHVDIIEAKGLLASDLSMGFIGKATSSDPYAVVVVDGQEQHTKVVKRTLHPRWDGTFKFNIRDPNTYLDVLVMDHDAVVGDSDDFLGWLHIPISDLVPGTVHTGWVPLVDNEAKELEAQNLTPQLGAVRLEVRLEITSDNGERWLSITGVPPAETPAPPAFDLDKLYSPSMLIIDLSVTRFVVPCINSILDTIQWTDPWWSTCWFALSLSLAYRPEYIPFSFWFLLALWHLSKRKSRKCKHHFKIAGHAVVAAERMHKAADQGGTKDDESVYVSKGGTEYQMPHTSNSNGSCDEQPPEEVHLGGFVSMVANTAPRWIKDTCREQQPTLQSVAEQLQMLHDCFTWDPKSPNAMPLQCALWFVAVLHLICPLRYVLIVEVVVVFTVLTPAFTIFLNSINYVLKAKPTGIANLHEEYNEEWTSTHAKKKENNQNRGLVRKTVG